MISITQPIVSCALVDPTKVDVKPMTSTLIERTEALSGCTYKIKTPLSEHALLTPKSAQSFVKVASIKFQMFVKRIASFIT